MGEPVSSAKPDRGAAIPSAENQQTVISHRPPMGSTSRPAGDATAHRPATIKLGTRLGDIELVEHIGGGGMGQVYRGEDKRLGRAVAVKVLARDQSSDHDAVRRFLNEARSAARLNHQNIAQVYSAGESENHPYIVFEYVEGLNLRTMIEEHGPLMLEEALSYTLQIADALAHASERRIVHRDVKPSNVLVAPNGQAKLIDLGLARLSTAGGPDGDLTASGVTLGTFDYISPEQARDPRNADSRSDIYSLGCTLFYMLAGRPPFPEGTVLQKLLQHQGDAPPDICQFRPDLPEEASLVLAKMMAKDPRRRYGDSARLMEALLSLADLTGLRPTGPAQAVWLPPQESRISIIHRQTPWLAPTMALACLVLALHFLWANEDGVGDLRDFRGPREAVASRESANNGQATRTPDETAPGRVSSGNDRAPSAGGGNVDPGTKAPESLNSQSPGAALSLASSSNHSSSPWLRTNADGGLPRLALAASVGPGRLSSGLFPVTPWGAAIPNRLSSSAALSGESELAGNGSGRGLASIPLVVTPHPRDASQYPSVEAALAANPDAALVELRYDGRSPERPFTLTNRQLTIRAAPSFTPIMAFQPTGVDPVLSPRDMIQIDGGELVIEGVAIELDVPRQMPSEYWTLVRQSSGGRIFLAQCQLRIRNASDTSDTYHKDVAFFRASPREGRGVAGPDSTRADRRPNLELQDCAVCGEACFFRASESLPFQITWRNGLLATTEAGFSIGGSSRTPSPGTAMAIDLQDVTAVTERALLHLVLASHRPHIAPIRVSDSSCLITGDPLIQADGVEDPGMLVKRLTWSSRSSKMQSSESPLVVTNSLAVPVEDPSLDSWLETAKLPESLSLVWQVPPQGPMNAVSLDAYRLNLTDSGITGESVPPGFVRGQVTGTPPRKPTTPD